MKFSTGCFDWKSVELYQVLPEFSFPQRCSLGRCCFWMLHGLGLWLDTAVSGQRPFRLQDSKSQWRMPRAGWWL